MTFSRIVWGAPFWRAALVRAALRSPVSTGLILPEEVGARAMFLGRVGKKSGRLAAAQLLRSGLKSWI